MGSFVTLWHLMGNNDLYDAVYLIETNSLSYGKPATKKQKTSQVMSLRVTQTQLKDPCDHTNTLMYPV